MKIRRGFIKYHELIKPERSIFCILKNIQKFSDYYPEQIYKKMENKLKKIPA